MGGDGQCSILSLTVSQVCCSDIIRMPQVGLGQILKCGFEYIHSTPTYEYSEECVAISDTYLIPLHTTSSGIFAIPYRYTCHQTPVYQPVLTWW